MLKNTLIKTKITTRKISRYLYFIIISITIVILGSASIFLYRNFYQTITQTKRILILQEKVAVETVDIDKFNQIMEKLAKKTLRKIENIKNPFK